MTDVDTWVLDNDRRLYRFWVYRRMFTPAEQDRKWMDQSIFEDSHPNYGYVDEAIELPDGDVILGFQYPECEHGELRYFKLSEIRLEVASQKEVELILEDDDLE